MGKIFIDACFKKKVPYTPVWMMRQAGRYLPQYQKVRKEAGDFLSLCHNAKLACEVTLQPVDILDVDAAILFSDILVVPNEMGMKLEFIKNEGPVFNSTIKDKNSLDKLDSGNIVANRLSYVYETIKLIKQHLNESKALIGFGGAPWTLATYMIEGRGSKTYQNSKKMLYSEPNLLKDILEKLTQTLKIYFENQIKAGADAIMIFDSWASAIEPAKYDEFSWSYMVKIAEFLKEKYPHIAIMLFPKGVSSFVISGGVYGNFDVFGVDWSLPMLVAKEKLGNRYTLQGNMEPTRLYSQKATTQCVEAIQEIMQTKNHIFNLGHGILPDIPVENAKHFINECKRVSKRY